jgi:hypothetical protein
MCCRWRSRPRPRECGCSSCRPTAGLPPLLPEADPRPGFYIDAAARDLGRFGEIGGGVISAGDVCRVDQSQMAMASASEPTPPWRPYPCSASAPPRPPLPIVALRAAVPQASAAAIRPGPLRRGGGRGVSRLDSWFRSQVAAPLRCGGCTSTGGWPFMTAVLNAWHLIRSMSRVRGVASRLWARPVRDRGGATPAQFVRGEENLNEGALMATRISVSRLSASAAATNLRVADGRSWHVDAPHRANT